MFLMTLTETSIKGGGLTETDYGEEAVGWQDTHSIVR